MTSILCSRTFLLAAIVPVLIAVHPRASAAQTPSDQPAAGVQPPAEIELNLIDLPTTLPLKSHHSYFRLTHRFARDLRRGDFGSLLEDFFSLDNGAVIGLEYRFGITSKLEAGVHRSTLSKTIQVFGRYDALRQGEARPVSISVLGSVEGLDNMQEHHQPGVAATVSRSFANVVVAYVTPGYVAKTRAVDFLSSDGDVSDTVGDLTNNYTVFVGFGARARVRPTVFVVGEYAPRVSGYDPGRGVWGFAIEKTTRGHVLQLNFSNSFGTTLGQIARGGSTHDVYLGFNLTRKF